MAADEWHQIVAELGAQMPTIGLAELELVHAASRIFVAGAGRSGLALRAFAMRLGQLGKAVAVVGDTTAPAFVAGDLLIVASGSTQTASIQMLVQKGLQLQGRVWLLTATADSALGQTVSHVTLLPGKGKFTTGAQTRQPMGSLFEQAVWVYGDAFTLAYMQRYHLTEADLQARHANLE